MLCKGYTSGRGSKVMVTTEIDGGIIPYKAETTAGKVSVVKRSRF